MTPSTTRKIGKTQRFKRLLQSKRLEFLMEAHNALSARIVEEAGFRDLGQRACDFCRPRRARQ